jgi:hypothetical protein
VQDPRLFEQIADALGTNPSLVEKDWHVVQAIKAISNADLAPAALIFTGGTCLSKAWKLIQRFSEDVDFKVAISGDYSRAQRRQFRARMISALQVAGFGLIEEIARDEGRFFILQLDYRSAFPLQVGLRPHIQIEVSMRQPKRDAIFRPIASFAAEARQMTPEVEGILCADPVETAAEKLSALSWRVLSFASQESDAGDPSMIRHLHDLAALEPHVMAATGFAELLREVIGLDTTRGSPERPTDMNDLLAAMLNELTKPHWLEHYETFIHSMSYATTDKVVSFDQAFASCQRLVSSIGNAPR